MIHRVKYIICFLSIFVTSATFCEAGSGTNETADIHLQRAKFKEIFDQLQPNVIYGKVTDTEGTPIHGAEVRFYYQQATLLIGKPDPGRFDVVASGPDGRWTFKVEKPHRAFVEDVRKPGYYSYKEGKSESARDLVSKPTTREEPVVVALRKKGETTFLMQREGRQLIRVFSPHSQTNSMDLLAEKPDKAKFKGYTDLEAAVNFDGTAGKWIVTYSSTNGTDGLVISDDLLYEAPQEGYQKEVVLNGPPWPRYLYVRSRTPEIYSRLDLEHSTWKESETAQGFRISYKAWINPYGLRNLEYDTDLEKEWRLLDQLEDEAKTAFRQNKRPAKPDLEKLVKETKEKDQEKQ